jgi:hypothetical protein
MQLTRGAARQAGPSQRPAGRRRPAVAVRALLSSATPAQTSKDASSLKKTALITAVRRWTRRAPQAPRRGRAAGGRRSGGGGRRGAAGVPAAAPPPAARRLARARAPQCSCAARAAAHARPRSCGAPPPAGRVVSPTPPAAAQQQPPPRAPSPRRPHPPPPPPPRRPQPTDTPQVKTPYLPNGKFDLKAYDALLNHQIENGVGGVIVGGTTGEGHLMSWDEHIMLIAHTIHSFGDRLMVIGNTGSNSTSEALHATEQGFAIGMHAALQINVRGVWGAGGGAFEGGVEQAMAADSGRRRRCKCMQRRRPPSQQPAARRPGAGPQPRTPTPAG